MSVTVSSYKNLVGGEWVDSASGETMEVLNPATGETIAEVPRGTAEDIGRAVEAAKKALPEWLETTPGERAEALLKLADLLDEHAEELAQLRLVGDIVLGEHRVDVTAELGGKRAEFRVVANQRFELAFDLVRKHGEVGGLFDALLALSRGGQREPERYDGDQQSEIHSQASSGG